MENNKHFLEWITVEEFKCFSNFHAEGFKRVNLIGGKNNVGKAWRILHLPTLKTVVGYEFSNKGDAEIHLKYHYFYLAVDTDIIFSRFTDHLFVKDRVCPLQQCEFEVAYTAANYGGNSDVV